MRIEIRHKFSGNVLFAHEQENNSTRITLEAGVNAHANLRGAYLEGAYLEGANLRGAYLQGAYLNDANLRGAYLEGAYLEGANLRGAYLNGANLRDAYLNGAYLDGAYLAHTNLGGATYGEGIEIGNTPLFILGLTWPVYIFKTHLKIGCQIHSKRAWLEFTDSDIAEMAPNASEFWKKWKKHILWMAMEETKE